MEKIFILDRRAKAGRGKSPGRTRPADWTCQWEERGEGEKERSQEATGSLEIRLGEGKQKPSPSEGGAKWERGEKRWEQSQMLSKTCLGFTWDLINTWCLFSSQSQVYTDCLCVLELVSRGWPSVPGTPVVWLSLWSESARMFPLGCLLSLPVLRGKC